MITYFLHFDPFGYAISPVSLVSVSLAAWCYMRGLARSARIRGTVSLWRQALFFAGLTCIFVATNASLASLGHSLFSVHQVEHLLLRLAGPLLIAVSQPWRILQAGLERRWRRYLGALANAWFVRFMAHPATATALLIASLFVWQIPVLYGLAQRIAAVELLAHLAMVLAGIWYFGMLFDWRDPPAGARRGARLISGFVVIVSNIFLGSLTTLKEVALYASYQTTGTGLSATLSDETIGGYVIWVPSSMVMIAAIILVMNGWNAAEVRRWDARYELTRASNSAALEFPETAEELRLKVAKPNRDMGRTLALGALVMFLIVMITVVTIVYAL
ncbi:cytochrome c oxidase assembly protein [Roseovarius indicus]|uniref:Cytochrome c oxidase caa3 assembly factor n=1 Tax=Roseovarius indicus TaxID=540747 RepID=A0A0T5NZ37_9RHOB|nr:cytochrome c oxidase assembly protein [Roseovarius indicus]KRS14151.1 membrane protein [Roseovarius indicus]QEW29939.1 Cytochrome c oxidase caa3 assembly factor [Roseovarius indicus]SFE81789.1 Cytochrome c oxidase assembly factor CtaG [Roseovarius indicus]